MNRDEDAPDRDDRDARHSADTDRLLRSADPAAGLAPLPARRLEELRRGALHAPAVERGARRPLRPTRLVLAGLGALAVAGAAVWLIVPGTGGGVTVLQPPVDQGLTAICAVPTAEAVGTAALAFRGTVASIEGGTATLEVSEVFTGDVSDTVTVAQGDPDDVVDGAAPTFEQGATYLVSAGEDDVILSCGLTGVDEPELAALYEQAF